MANFSIVHNATASEIQVDLLPQLSSHVCRDTSETKAGQLWTNFGRLKSHSGMEEGVPTSVRDKGKSSPSELNSKKTGRKTQWQPLKL